MDSTIDGQIMIEFGMAFLHSLLFVHTILTSEILRLVSEYDADVNHENHVGGGTALPHGSVLWRRLKFLYC